MMKNHILILQMARASYEEYYNIYCNNFIRILVPNYTSVLVSVKIATTTTKIK